MNSDNEKSKPNEAGATRPFLCLKPLKLSYILDLSMAYALMQMNVFSSSGDSGMEGHNFEQLKQHILSLSESQVFEVARTEWKLHSIEISEEWDSCPCGQSIKEHCYIENQKNGKKTYVGNVCINRFMKIDTGTLIDGLKRIRENIRANANEALIEYARQKGYLYGEKDYNFLLSTMNKRKLSEAQLSWKEKINNRILKGTVVQKRTSR